jgi:tripartite-type tricarboxylate transporter receptor subunit TctC
MVHNVGFARSNAFRRRTLLAAFAASGFALADLPAQAQSVAEFYKGKTITMITAGSNDAGSYAIRTRLIGRYIGKHIPGNPTIVYQHVPGAIAGVNYVYNVAAKNGTAIALAQRTVFTAQYLAPKEIQFDMTKLNWIGNVASDVGVFLAWHTSPVQTADDLFTKEMITAAPSSFSMSTVLNLLIGTKFKVVAGYPTEGERVLAAERGEVEGPGEMSWGTVKGTLSEALQNGHFRVILQNGLKKAPDLPNVPLSRDFATGDNLVLLDTFLMQREVAFPVFMPPGVPADRVAAVRAAFMALAKDAEFQEEAKKLQVDFEPMTGEEVEKAVAQIAALPEPLVQRLKELTGP